MARRRHGLGGAPTIIANPDGAAAKFGYVIAAAGDLNGDGYGDLAVGECGSAGGHVHVYFGGPGGIRRATQALGAPDAPAASAAASPPPAISTATATPTWRSRASAKTSPAGSTSIRGSAAGLPTTTTRIDSPDYKPSRLGYSLAGVGNLDGDGFADLVATEIDASAASGHAHVYRGGPDGITNARQVTLVSPDPSGLQFGALGRRRRRRRRRRLSRLRRRLRRR